MFSDEMVRASARERQDVVAITAAMLIPVGLRRLRRALPRPRLRRRHRRAARASRWPPAWPFGGLHPVVAVYATFLNRAFDQLLMDVRAAQGRRDLRARPRRRHRHRRRLAQRHVGHGDRARSCPACGWPPRATASRCARSCARPSTSTTRRPCVRFPKGDVGRARHRAAQRRRHRRARTSPAPAPRPAARRRRRRWPSTAVRGRREARGPGPHDPGRRPALGPAGQRRPRRPGPRRRRRWPWSRTTSSPGGIGSAVDARPAATPGSTSRCTCTASPSEFLDHASRGQVLEEVGLTADAVATSLAAALSR